MYQLDYFRFKVEYMWKTVSVENYPQGRGMIYLGTRFTLVLYTVVTHLGIHQVVGFNFYFVQALSRMQKKGCRVETVLEMK